MVQLVFREVVVKCGLVYKVKHFFHITGKPHFFLQTALGGRFGRFADSWMAATGVGPEPTAVVFVQGALLHHHLAFVIKNENGECTVQQAFFMGFHFLHQSELFILLVNQDNFFQNFELNHVKTMAHIRADQQAILLFIGNAHALL